MTVPLTTHEKQVLVLLAEGAVTPSGRLAPAKITDLIRGLSVDVQPIAHAIAHGVDHPVAKVFVDWAREGLPAAT